VKRTPLLLGLPLILAAVFLAGCEDEGYDPPDPQLRIELADSLYSPALFDTIAWPSHQERIDAGNLVYADYCRRCHGPVGEGGPAEVGGRQLQVPSLVQAEWRLHDDIQAVRERTFTGHTGGMPSWGISRLTPREIDAVAFYILEQLRPELLSPDTVSPAIP
jgi:mono/diheme cytochrome c family protein